MKLSASLFFLLICSKLSFCQTQADDILGKWINPDGTRKMEIFKSGTSYFGKLIWMSESTTKAKIGDVVLQDFIYANGKWKGKVITKNDHYSGSLKLEGNTLSITASAGFLSKTRKWTRTSD